MNFGGIPKEYSSYEDSAIVILPVPFDATSTWTKGADKGPDAILEASANMELYDIETDSEVYLKGIYTATATNEKRNPEKLAAEVERRVTEYLDRKKFVVTLGGEHTVSIGAAYSHVKKFDRLTVLQLDAHTDMRDEYEGSRFNHACVMSRISEVAPYIQVGIRSTSGEEKIDPENKIFFAHDMLNSRTWMDEAIAGLSDNVYLTLDLDVLDPSIMPSTGTPEPGGMLWYETLEFLRQVMSSRNLVGFDVSELCPNKFNRAPDFLTAKLIYRILSHRFCKL